LIRKYQPSDRDEVRRICVETAFMGEPGNKFVDGDELLADFLTAYFTDCEPDSCFVAEEGGKVIGYLIGAKDCSKIGNVFVSKKALSLFLKAIFSGALFKLKNLCFIRGLILGFLRGEFRQPDFSRNYPATLHINISSGFRGKGIGAQLIREFFQYLKDNEVKAVHCATFSNKAACFFEKEGFSRIACFRRSYFHSLLKRDIEVYVYGKRIIL